ncbi:hypothetical protein RJ639_039839 [Escallonia herrerae]|uniref:Uncharacterized protein n=1 Tax=Escallonia herrerae TaxID=1293975 RepID=A0AA89BFL9_9ASTE|nr:hypothetical protein RJ639_039839 [Escallonia herrerae]
MDVSDGRPNRTVGSTSSNSNELFICFNSRLSSSSSSSMKMSSKSILSPGRARDPPSSLSTSVSRRLRTNGSMKGGQASPMFPTGGKKRGCAFENPEPSSPKVTCIGQVRVKTKKQGRKMRTLSKRHNGEASFRKIEQARDGICRNQSQNQTCQASSSSQYQNQQQQGFLPQKNQRWVICEALRAFGAEFSCLFPCKSSCFSNSERVKEEKTAAVEEDGEQGSCGAMFARWLVGLQDGEGGGKGREIELVVGGDEEERSRELITERLVRNSRRHVFDEIVIAEEMCEAKGGDDEQEEARVSVCIPPKNALLLMRCRSDPVKMEALANRFWESPVANVEHEDEMDCKEQGIESEDEPEDVPVFVAKESRGENEHEIEQAERNRKTVFTEILDGEEEPLEAEVAVPLPGNLQHEDEEEIPEEISQVNADLQEEEDLEETEVNQQEMEEEENALISSNSPNEEEESLDLGSTENEEENKASNPASTDEQEVQQYSEAEEEVGVEKTATIDVEAEAALVIEAKTEESDLEKKIEQIPFEEEEIVTHERSESESESEEETEQEVEDEGTKSEEREAEMESQAEEVVEVERERKSDVVLPDCLLLMMCEPKLSMEVSKETWVCSTDFIRWQPEKKQVKVKPKNNGDEGKKRVSVDSERPPAQQHVSQQQPPRSSCSLPATAAAVAGMSMATMIEQKLVNAVGYEPFVLTRCKSEPIRTAASKLVPDSCFWKNRKLEPHRRSAFGVGAAGVGF